MGDVDKEERRIQMAEAADLYRSGRAAEAAQVLMDLRFDENELLSRAYAVFCSNLGAALSESGRFQQAILFLKKAARIHESDEDWADAALVAFNLGNTYGYLGAREASLTSFEHALQLAQKGDKPDLVLQVRLNLADALASSGNARGASLHLEEARGLITRQKEPRPAHLRLLIRWPKPRRRVQRGVRKCSVSRPTVLRCTASIPFCRNLAHYAATVAASKLIRRAVASRKTRSPPNCRTVPLSSWARSQSPETPLNRNFSCQQDLRVAHPRNFGLEICHLPLLAQPSCWNPSRSANLWQSVRSARKEGGDNHSAGPALSYVSS